MTTGMLLLAATRGRRAEELDDLIGPGHDEARAALVATLLSGYRESDAPLIRALTRAETDAVRAVDDGCGDVLLACCWLLFMLGDVADSALIWEAKNLTFDTHSYLDSVFLVPQGPAATARFARAEGLDDLAKWVESGWIADLDESAAQWRQTSFFARVPPPAASVAELASWMRT